MTTTTVEGAPESATQELRDQAKAVRKDIADLGRTAKTVAKEKMVEGRRHAGEYLEQGKQKVIELEDQFEGYVRKQPLKSVLIAAGAGALIGFLIGRK